MSLDIKVEKEGSVTVVQLVGNLIDQQQSENLFGIWEKELENGNKHFVVDMSDAKYMNSTGLNILINLLTKTRNGGGEVVLANLSDKIKELYMITKLDSIFSIKDSVQDAIREVSNE